MELLAPAGSEPALIAAVQSGANAVYIGGNRFSARNSAKNFSIEDMKRLIEYCHIRGVDVHVAANILVKEKEKNEFIDYVGAVNEIGADALIIQDIGMASEVRRCFPDLPLHASTQMTAASLDAVRFLEKMGFSRVVLSRELSEKEIEYICKNSNIEIEVFVHGALCMCYSGQCLMSSMIGGRSGNRGMCAQPCRLAYEMTDGKNSLKKGYLLSPKDLALLDELGRLKKAGVTSLKIEGRLKRPEYVAAVVSTYCKYINFTDKPYKNDWKVLKDAFNRSGFTKGYFTDNLGKSMMSVNTPGNVSDNIFSKEIVEYCREDANFRKTNIDIFASLSEGKVLELTITDSDFNSVTVQGEIKAQKALNKPLSKERLTEQILKLGNTPFLAVNTEINCDDGIILPISEINNVRRKCISELEKLRCRIPKKRSCLKSKNTLQIKKTDGYILSAQVQTLEQTAAVLKFDIPIIYAPSEIAEKIKSEHPEKKIVTVLPPVWREKKISDLYSADGVLISNPGQLEFFSKQDCYGGFRLNIYNSESIKFYKDLKSITISPELNLKEIKKLVPYAPLEILVYGRLPLMVMENCPNRAYSSCGKRTFLKDRRNEEFPLVCAPGCFSELLNSKPVYMADKAAELLDLPVNIYKFAFSIESGRECENIISGYMNAFSGMGEIYKMRENTFTRGHYYRGVE